MKNAVSSAVILAGLTAAVAHYWFGATSDQFFAIGLWAAALWFVLGTVLVMLQYRMAVIAAGLASAAAFMSFPGALAGPMAIAAFAIVAIGLFSYLNDNRGKWS